MTGGVGLLWDRGGDDSYAAAGLVDAYDRGGGVSMAQGAATGLRTMLGGGAGILRDDSGNDHYEAQMFAQGTGYYYGVGLLWDRGGADHYAQCATHKATACTRRSACCAMNPATTPTS